MAASGRSGVEIDLDLVPLQKEGMEPWEMGMMSESQERMLLCVRKGYEEEMIQIFQKWGLEREIIGELKIRGKVTIKYRGEIVADIPALELTIDLPFIPLLGKGLSI